LKATLLLSVEGNVNVPRTVQSVQFIVQYAMYLASSTRLTKGYGDGDQGWPSGTFTEVKQRRPRLGTCVDLNL